MPDMEPFMRFLGKLYLPLYHISVPLNYLQLFLGVFGVTAIVTGFGFHNRARGLFIALGLYLLAGIRMMAWMHGSGWYQ